MSVRCEVIILWENLRWDLWKWSGCWWCSNFNSSCPISRISKSSRKKISFGVDYSAAVLLGLLLYARILPVTFWFRTPPLEFLPARPSQTPPLVRSCEFPLFIGPNVVSDEVNYEVTQRPINRLICKCNIVTSWMLLRPIVGGFLRFLFIRLNWLLNRHLN